MIIYLKESNHNHIICIQQSLGTLHIIENSSAGARVPLQPHCDSFYSSLSFSNHRIMPISLCTLYENKITQHTKQINTLPEKSVAFCLLPSLKNLSVGKPSTPNSEASSFSSVPSTLASRTSDDSFFSCPATSA